MRNNPFSTFKPAAVLMAVMGLQAGVAGAQEQGRVISATPLTQPVSVQRQVCPVDAAGIAGTACTLQTFSENRAVAYDVVYEYGGKQFSVQMPQDPGPVVQLQISAVPPVAAQPVGVAPPTTVMVGAPAPVYVSPAPTVVYTTPYPYYWGPGYAYPPVGVSLRFGYWGGGHRRWR